MALRINLLLALMLLILSVASYFSLEIYRSMLAIYQEFDDGTVARVRMTKQNYSDKVVTKWTKSAIVDSFFFGHNDVDAEIKNAAESWYTFSGRKHYSDQLRKQQIRSSLKEKELFLRSAILTPIHIIANRKRPGIELWRAQAGLIMSFYNVSGESISRKYVVDLLIRTVKHSETISGLAISRIVFGASKNV